MRLETFFEKFELFADAPNAVAKMRELVLELAFEGKLVQQIASEEPASAQMLRIAAEKAKIGRVTRTKASNRETAGAARSDKRLPTGWSATTLAELVTVINGRAYSKDELLAAGTPVLRVGNLFTSNHWYYSDLALEDDKYCDKGDLIFAWSASFGPFIWPGPKVIYHYHIWKLALHSEVDLSKSYLYWFLQNRTQEIKRAGHGVSMVHMTKEKMEKLEVLLPPLAEQKRIVAKVNELMALCDRLEAQQQEREARHAALARASLARFAEAPTPANLEFLFHNAYTITPADLRKTILTLAVQGKLVPQHPNDEPALCNLPKGTAIDSSALPDLPRGWAWTRVDEAGRIDLGRQRAPQHHRGPNMRPYLRVQNVYEACIDVSDIKEMNFTPDEFRRFALKPNDLLLNEGQSRELVGRPAIYRGEVPGACFQNTLVRFRHQRFVIPEYALIVFRAYMRNGRFQEVSKQTTNIAHLSAGRFAALEFPLPPIPEQRRIVAKVDKLMALVDQLEAQLAEASEKGSALLEAVIHGLLNPTAEVVDSVAYRSAVGCYAIKKMAHSPYFGRTAAAKVFYLAQAHVGLDLNFQPSRQAAGPLDQWVYRFEEEGQRKGWFNVRETETKFGKKIEYRPGQRLPEQCSRMDDMLSTAERKELDRLLALLTDKKTEEVEIIATLFAAWNDLIIDRRNPTDEQIITEVREHWHEKKQRFTPARLREWLGWLRRNEIVPTGRPPRTSHQTQLAFH